MYTRNYLLQLKTPRSGIITMMLKYNQHGELVSAELRDFDMGLNDTQREWLWGYIPKTTEALAKQSRAKVTAIETELSFDDFWELYDYKVGNKKRAKESWDKLDDATRALVMAKVKEYNYYMAHVSHAKVFPERFLAQRRWENDFRIKA
jgi:hypothetical protein